MTTLHIATACFLNADNALLVVRKKGARMWMLPGGKLEAAETPEQAVVRELAEELHLHLPLGALQALGRFQATAANERDTRVDAHVFRAALPQDQVVRIAAEIEALKWLPLSASARDDVAPLLRDHIVPALLAALAR